MELWINYFSTNINRIDYFFEQKLEEIKHKFRKLKNDIDNLVKQNQKFAEKEEEELYIEGEADLRKCEIKDEVAKDDLGYASSWRRASSDLYVLTSWLEGFANINEIASRVLIKKMDNLLNSEAAPHDFTKILNQKQFVIKKQDIEDLKHKIKKYYAEQFTGNNLYQAEIDIDEKMNGSNNLKDNFVFYFCIGVLITLIFYLPISFYIPYGNISF